MEFGAVGVRSKGGQCAGLAGATVIATAGSAAKAERVSALGADAVVVRTGGAIAADLLHATGSRRFDVVLDTVGGGLFGAHLSVLREEGTLVTCGAHAGEVAPLDLIPLFRNGWRIVGFRPAPPDDLAASLKLIRRGTVKVPSPPPSRSSPPPRRTGSSNGASTSGRCSLSPSEPGPSMTHLVSVGRTLWR